MPVWLFSRGTCHTHTVAVTFAVEGVTAIPAYISFSFLQNVWRAEFSFCESSQRRRFDLFSLNSELFPFHFVSFLRHNSISRNTALVIWGCGEAKEEYLGCESYNIDESTRMGTKMASRRVAFSLWIHRTERVASLAIWTGMA